MVNWYYYTRGGQIGPVSTEAIKSLAKQGVISRDTIIENERGVKRSAGSISGIEFGTEPYKVSEDLSSAFAQPNSAHPNFSQPSNFPDLPPLAESLMKEPQSLPPSSVPVPQRNEPSEKPFLRFIYIFLAVFVGIFGIHDFYAKRSRAGWIHLGLLSPYLIPLICSILAVPIWTIYTICYQPNMLDIVQCKSKIREIESQIQTKKKELDEVEKQRDLAMECKFKLDTPPKPPQKSPKWDKTEEPKKTPSWDETKDCQPDSYTMQVLQQQVTSLEHELNALDNTLQDLTNQLARYERLRNAKWTANWLITGQLWIYFIFAVLPFFSWVMAMYEIVVVTRDGRGIELE